MVKLIHVSCYRFFFLFFLIFCHCLKNFCWRKMQHSHTFFKTCWHVVLIHWQRETIIKASAKKKDCKCSSEIIVILNSICSGDFFFIYLIWWIIFHALEIILWYFNRLKAFLFLFNWSINELFWLSCLKMSNIHMCQTLKASSAQNCHIPLAHLDLWCSLPNLEPAVTQSCSGGSKGIVCMKLLAFSATILLPGSSLPALCHALTNYDKLAPHLITSMGKSQWCLLAMAS